MPLAISSNCECRPIADRHCEFVIRCCRTTALRGPTNFLQKEVAMKRSTPHVHRAARRTRRQLGGKRRELRVHPHYSYVGKPALPDARFDAQLQADTVTCDDAVGVQRATPSATYRSRMLVHGWKYSYVTQTKVQAAPARADPYFSSNAKVKPGHFIDHDNGWTARTSAAPRSAIPRMERCIISTQIRTC